MKRYAVPGLVLLLATLGVVIVIQAAYLSRLERKIDQIERDLNQVAARPPAENNEAARDDEPEPFTGSPRNLNPKKDEKVDAPIDDPNLSEELKSFIRKTAKQSVDEAFKSRDDHAQRDRKPPLEKVVKELKLDPVARQKFAEYLNGAKDDAFYLLKTPRADGGNFVDDFVAAVQSENMEAEAGRVYQRLIGQQDKVPGSDQSFIQGYQSIQKLTNDSLKTILSEDQWKTLEGMGIDPMDIRTGHEPWQDYFKAQGAEWPEDW